MVGEKASQSLLPLAQPEGAYKNSVHLARVVLISISFQVNHEGEGMLLNLWRPKYSNSLYYGQGPSKSSPKQLSSCSPCSISQEKCMTDVLGARGGVGAGRVAGAGRGEHRSCFRTSVLGSCLDVSEANPGPSQICKNLGSNA